MTQRNRDEAALVARLKRIEGQVRGLIAMVEARGDCEPVVQQFAATRKAMDRAFYELMACVTRHELAEAGLTGSKARSGLDRAAALLAKYG